MRFGFGRCEITPRVGVEMSGFGPFLNRHALGVRDRLWARAMAVEHGEKRLVLVSCDLIGVEPETTRRVRELVAAEAGLEPDAVMVHCTHTHSGPAVNRFHGWGVPDPPYLEILPGRIARACLDALASTREAVLSHARVPCEGVGLNREYDKDAPPLEEVLRDDWRPALPERTDTACDVLRVDADGDGECLGFLSYFGCHPVVCCSQTRQIHGDFAGVATNLLEREMLGAVGLFLQGAQGDVNSCVVHKPEPEALLALDVIAARYANAVRAGLRGAQPLDVDRLACVRREVTFSRVPLGVPELRDLLAEKEAVLHAPGASDADREVRMAAVWAITLRELIGKLEAGRPVAAPTELQGFRVGPVALLGTPFEIFQAVKNEAVSRARAPIPLVLGLTNEAQGYAPDRQTAARGGYAAGLVPIILGSLPYQDIHGELVEALLSLDAALAG